MKESDFIHILLTKSKNEKFYYGRCILTGYAIAVTYEENLIDSICTVIHENSNDYKKSTETQYLYDKTAKIHLTVFSFDAEETRVLFLKTNDGKMLAAFQTIANTK